jgi:hypothetical protein
MIDDISFPVSACSDQVQELKGVSGFLIHERWSTEGALAPARGAVGTGDALLGVHPGPGQRSTGVVGVFSIRETGELPAKASGCLTVAARYKPSSCSEPQKKGMVERAVDTSLVTVPDDTLH